MQLAAFEAHIASLLQNWRELMQSHQFDAAVVHAGANPTYYQDDQHPPFHAYGHFLRWVPTEDCEHAVLLISQTDRPKLYWHKPDDYWYMPSSPPTFCEGIYEIREFSDVESLTVSLRRDLGKYSDVASFGPSNTNIEANNRAAAQQDMSSQLDFRRAFKSEFEQDCIREATVRSVRGHLAAERAFLNGASEFDIQHDYLHASKQTEASLPYPSIVGLNEHAAVLHYQKYDRTPPQQTHSLLIDAGAKANCYHADITRTYAASNNGEFAELINAVNLAQQALIEEIHVGVPYLRIHESMHQKVATILCDMQLLTCSAEAAFEQRMTDVFFPHGIGHLLGLQTHDVGGHVSTPEGSTTPSHDRYSSLRLLRNIEPDMVFTIEPGIYFIPSLLNAWRGHADFNWERINQFTPSGGVRIEDNVLVQSNNLTNFTRDAFTSASAGDLVANAAT